MSTPLITKHAVTKCDQCGEWDDHPKVHSLSGWTRHHHCVSHDHLVDILGGAHSQHALITARIFKAARDEGLRGGDLREFIGSQEMRDFGDAVMSGVDQTLANATLTAWLPTTGTATVGTVTITAPITCRFDSAMGSDTAAATEWTTAGGYTAGGVSVGANWAAASGGSRATSGAVTVTNAPAQTWAGNELWDSSATKLRILWGAITGGNKTVNSGDTCTINSGSLTGQLA